MYHINVDDLIGRGPHGEQPAYPASVELSDTQIELLQEENFCVSILFHYLKTAWTDLQLRGLKERFEEIGITVVEVKGSNFDAGIQSDILTSIDPREVDALVSIPVDTVATAEAYRSLANHGVDIVFMDNVPEGFTHPHDYSGMVSSDNESVGIVAGRQLHRLIGEGSVGFIKHDAPFYVTKQREIGALSVLQGSDEIDIVAETGFTSPDNVYDKAKAMLRANPDLDGLFVSWDNPPGIQAATAATDLSRDDIVITATDFTERTAEMIAENGPIRGVGAQFPYQQGIIEANMIGQALLGNQTPPYIASGSLPVCRDNLLKQYTTHYQRDPPKLLTKHFDDPEAVGD